MANNSNSSTSNTPKTPNTSTSHNHRGGAQNPAYRKPTPPPAPKTQK